MSIGQLASTLLQDPLQSLFQQPAADPLSALLGGGLGSMGGTVDPGISALLGGQLNPTNPMIGGNAPGSQLMMTLASMLLGNNSPLDQFPQLNGNQPLEARPAPEPEPDLPVVADRTSINGSQVTLGKDLLEKVAKNPEQASELIQQELKRLAGGDDKKVWEVLNLFRADNPTSHSHGGKEDKLYKELVDKLSQAAIKQSEPFKETAPADGQPQEVQAA